METYYSSDEEIAWGPVTLREIKDLNKQPRKINYRHTDFGQYMSAPNQMASSNEKQALQNPDLVKDMENKLNVSGTSAYFTPDETCHPDQQPNRNDLFLEKLSYVINDSHNNLETSYASALDNTNILKPSTAVDDTLMRILRNSKENDYKNIDSIYQTLVEDTVNLSSDEEPSINKLNNSTIYEASNELNSSESCDVIVLSDDDDDDGTNTSSNEVQIEPEERNIKTERYSYVLENLNDGEHFNTCNSEIEVESEDSKVTESSNVSENNFDHIQTISSSSEVYESNNERDLSEVYESRSDERDRSDIYDNKDDERDISEIYENKEDERDISEIYENKDERDLSGVYENKNKRDSSTTESRTSFSHRVSENKINYHRNVSLQHSELNLSGVYSLDSENVSFRSGSKSVSSNKVEDQYYESLISDSLPHLNAHELNDVSNRESDEFGFNDTLEEMERALRQGLDYVMPEDEATAKKQNENRPAFAESFGKKSNKPISKSSEKAKYQLKTPVRKFDYIQSPVSDYIKKKSPVHENFKLPTKIPRAKVTPNPKSPSVVSRNFKNIVSPIGIYIKNSPGVCLKQNVPVKTVSHLKTTTSKSTVAANKENAHFHLPEVIYKPPKKTFTVNQKEIVLPSSIQKLVQEPVIAKHEKRIKQIDLNRTAVSKKLLEEDLTSVDSSLLNTSNEDASFLTCKQAFIK